MKEAHSLRKFLTLSILIAYSFLTLSTLMSFGHDHEHMNTMTNNCPYMVGIPTLCVNVFDHINGWQNFSTIVFPQVLLLTVILVFFNIFTRSFSPPRLFSRYRLAQLPEEYYQALFSKGILNSKAP